MVLTLHHLVCTDKQKTLPFFLQFYSAASHHLECRYGFFVFYRLKQTQIY